MTFQTGTYVKGDQVRVANTPREAVKATWDGFVRASAEADAHATRKDLQARAKALGIPANQATDVLRDAIANFKPESDEVDSPQGGDDQVDEPADGENPDAPVVDNGGSPLG